MIADEGSQRASPYNWYALGILTLVYLVNFVDRQILSILANDVKADLGITDAQLGFLYGTAFAIFYALFGIPLGRLADGTRRLRVLSLGLALWSAMTVLSGLARNATQLTLARVGVGVGEASANPCAYSLISDWFPRRQRALALSIYSAGLFVGSGLSLVIGGAIVEWWQATWPADPPFGLAGWQAAFVIVGLPGLALALWLLTLREPARGALDQQAADDREGAWRGFGIEVMRIVPPFTLLSAARRGRRALAANCGVALALGGAAWLLGSATGNMAQFGFVAAGWYAVYSWASALREESPQTFALTWGSAAFMGIAIAYAADCYVGYTITLWAAPYAERVFALSKTDLGLMIGAPNALGGFLGVIGGGWLADRWAKRWAGGRAGVLLIALLAPVPLVVIGYSARDLDTFLFCNFLAQAATATALGASAAATQALVRPDMRGTAAAIFLLGPALIALAFGPFTAGLISEATGDLGLGIKASLLVAIPGTLATLIALRGYRGALAKLA